MHISPIEMPQLFEQLGLDSSNLAIARFVKNHHLPADTKLQAADFWTKSQRQFINDGLQQDADWCEVIDKLDALLRH